MKVDLHTHTVLSCDAHATMEGYLRQAEETGIDLFCVTEHIDYNELDWGYGFYDPDAYFKKLSQVRSAYDGRVRILAGLEFSEPHLYAAELARLSEAYPYDFIIGSLHWVKDMFPAYDHKLSAKDFFAVYWTEVLAAAKCGGFDSLGHIDFPKRYYGELWYDESLVREICKHLVENDISLEINTSSLRKGLDETMPGEALLAIYRSVGGTYITVGSDAHEDCDLGADNDAAKALIAQYGLQEVIYTARKRIVL